MDMNESRKKDDTGPSGTGLGDDQGARVGPSDARAGSSAPTSDRPSPRPERQTGAGSEATEGMHNAKQDGGRDESDNTGLEAKAGNRGATGEDTAGSEPLTEKGVQHRSGYGGAGGAPVTSSDTREPPRKQ